MITVTPPLACSRLSDSGEDAKEKGMRKVGGAGKRKKEKGREFPAFLFPCLRFLNSPDPTTLYLGAWNRLHHLPREPRETFRISTQAVQRTFK